MKPPIICNDTHDPEASGDLSVYDSVEWAQKGHEPYDAKDPNFRIYDSEGRLLRMRPIWETYEVRLEPVEDAPNHLDQLTRVVKDYLRRIDAPPHLVERPLAEMLDYIYQRDPNPYAGYRRPGDPVPGFWRGLIEWFHPPKRR